MSLHESGTNHLTIIDSLAQLMDTISVNKRGRVHTLT